MGGGQTIPMNSLKGAMMSFIYNPGDLLGPRKTLFLERTHKEGRRLVWFSMRSLRI